MPERVEPGPREQHHTLLNHIAVVSSYAHLLSDTELDPDQAEMVGEIASAAKRALAVANELGAALGSSKKTVDEQRAS